MSVVVVAEAKLNFDFLALLESIAYQFMRSKDSLKLVV
jgi:hypothetical protein